MAGGWLGVMLGKSTSVPTAVNSGRTLCFPPFVLSRNCTRFLHSARNALLQISMGSGVDCVDLSDVAVTALKEAQQCSLAMNASLTSQLDFDPSYRNVQSRDYLYNAFFIIPIIQNHVIVLTVQCDRTRVISWIDPSIDPSPIGRLRFPETHL